MATLVRTGPARAYGARKDAANGLALLNLLLEESFALSGWQRCAGRLDIDSQRIGMAQY